MTVSEMTRATSLCRTIRRRTIGEFGRTTEREVCLLHRPVQRAICTEMPLAENSRNHTIRKGSNATKGNVESLLFSPIVIVIRPTLDITINAIVVAPQFWSLFINIRAIQRSEGVAFVGITAVEPSTRRRDGTVDCTRRVGSIIRSNVEFVRGPSS